MTFDSIAEMSKLKRKRKNDVWAACAEWVRAQHGGAVHQALALSTDESSGEARGVVAQHGAVAAAEQLLCVPLPCVVSSLRATAWLSRSFTASEAAGATTAERGNGDSSSGVASASSGGNEHAPSRPPLLPALVRQLRHPLPDVALALFAAQHSSSCESSTSFWDPYWATLPTEADLLDSDGAPPAHACAARAGARGIATALDATIEHEMETPLDADAEVQHTWGVLLQGSPVLDEVRSEAAALLYDYRVLCRLCECSGSENAAEVLRSKGQEHGRGQEAEAEAAAAAIGGGTASMPSLRRFLWGMAVVSSRAFSLSRRAVAEAESAVVASAMPLNDGADDEKESCALVPMLDLLNHQRPRQAAWSLSRSGDATAAGAAATGAVTAAVVTDNAPTAVVLVARVPFARGAEVVETYGAKGNGPLFVRYGFALLDNAEPDGSSNDVRPLHFGSVVAHLRVGPPSYTYGQLARALAGVREMGCAGGSDSNGGGGGGGGAGGTSTGGTDDDVVVADSADDSGDFSFGEEDEQEEGFDDEMMAAMYGGAAKTNDEGASSPHGLKGGEGTAPPREDSDAVAAAVDTAEVAALRKVSSACGAALAAYVQPPADATALLLSGKGRLRARVAAAVTLGEQLALEAYSRAAALAADILERRDDTAFIAAFSASAEAAAAEAAAAAAQASEAVQNSGSAAAAPVERVSTAAAVNAALVRAGDRTVLPLVRAYLRVRYGALLQASSSGAPGFT